jgi:hypothetical protein
VQCHRNERRTSKYHVDADQKADRPRGRCGQAHKYHARQDEIDDAADKHHSPPAGELLLVLEREEDRRNTFHGQEHRQDQCERDGARQGPPQQHDARDDAEEGGQQGPPETRRAAHPDGGNQADDAAQEDEPADQYFDRDRRDLRNDDGEEAQDQERDSFDQKELPVALQGVGDGRLNSTEVRFGRRHREPLPLLPVAAYYLGVPVKSWEEAGRSRNCKFKSIL